MTRKRDLSPDAALQFPDYLGYFFGAGTNISSYIVSVFLIVYYSNVLYLGLTTISMLLGIFKIFDGFSDLLMGRIIDRTKSSFGKARPWYIRMVIPTAVSLMLLYWVPADLSGVGRYIYIFITYNMVTTVCFTANAVAHASMIGFMTLNSKSHGMTGVLSMIANTLFTLSVTNFFFRLCRFYGNGEAYTQKSFSLAVLTYTLIYTVCAVLAFLLTKERIQNTAENITKESDNVSFLTALRSLYTNKYWILCIIMCLGFYFLFSYVSSVVVYFSQYILNDLDMQGTLASVLYIMVLVGIAAALPVMNKKGKRFTMALGLLIAAIGWFMPQLSTQKNFVTTASLVAGFGFGCIAVPAGSFLQDTLTYGTWKSGISAVGMGNAVFSFVNKLASALGTVILGVVLDAGHFDAAASVQPASAIATIRFLYIWLPTGICLACFLLSFLYDLDKNLPYYEQEIKLGRIGSQRVAPSPSDGRWNHFT